MWALIVLAIAAGFVFVLYREFTFKTDQGFSGGDGNQVWIGPRRYTLNKMTGLVADSGVRSEVEVSGTGYVTGTTGTSYSPGIVTGTTEIKSKTTRHQQLFLIDKEGNEESFNLTDFVITCHKGSLITIIWAIMDGKKDGPIFAAYNHDTKGWMFDDKGVDGMCGPVAGPLWPLGWGTLSVFLVPSIYHPRDGADLVFITGLACLLFALGIGRGMKRLIIKKNFKAFTGGRQWNALADELESIKKSDFKTENGG